MTRAAWLDEKKLGVFEQALAAPPPHDFHFFEKMRME
jgi:hypothetical protein